MIKKNKLLRTAFCGILMGCLLLSQPAVSVTAESTQSTEEPAEESHSSTYWQTPDTDSIPGWPAGPSVEAGAALLMEVNTDTILYAKNIDEKKYPASITKIMTALLAAENLDMNDQFAMSASAAFGIEAGSSSIYGDADEVFTVEQAMMGLMLESANECAIALGEEVSGSMKKFVELMNERARQLGCTNTHFNNPHGLPDETHYTTAHDMALIAKAAYLNPVSRSVMTTSYYEIPPTNKQKETRYLSNHHKMMEGKDYAYEGVLGGKTGYTIAAGNTLVTYAKRGSMTLIAVVLQSVGGAYGDTQTLLDYGFNSFKRINMGWEKEPQVMVLPSEKHILNMEETTSAFYSVRAASTVIPADADPSQLTYSTELLNPTSGSHRIKTVYYFHDHPVGGGMQYEKEVLPNLLQ